MSLVLVCDNCDKELDGNTVKYEVSHQPLLHQNNIEMTGTRSKNGGHFCSKQCVSDYFDEKPKKNECDCVGDIPINFNVNIDNTIDRISKELANHVRRAERRRGLR